MCLPRHRWHHGHGWTRRTWRTLRHGWRADWRSWRTYRHAWRRWWWTWSSCWSWTGPLLGHRNLLRLGRLQLRPACQYRFIDLGEPVAPEPRHLGIPPHLIRRPVRVEELAPVELELLLFGDVGGKRRPSWRERQRHLVGSRVDPECGVVCDLVHHVGTPWHL